MCGLRLISFAARGLWILQLLLLEEGTAQLPPAPPPPPPPVPPQPPVIAATMPPPIDPDDHMHAQRERHLKDMAPTGVHFEQGLWIYGDYKSMEEAKTPIACSKACEEDNGCLHWNFHVVHHKCDLKHHASGHNEGAPDWISGNARRYLAPGAKIGAEL